MEKVFGALKAIFNWPLQLNRNVKQIKLQITKYFY